MTTRPSWRDYQWEYLRSEPLTPLLQMALDEVLLDQVADGQRKPTLRIWDWAGNAVILGRFQSVKNEVDMAGADRHDVQVVRRITGGGAMFVEPGNTITYSIYAPRELIAGLTTIESYAFFDQWVLDAMAELGVKATYQPINDITSPGGKIAGAAQIRVRNAVLHHVTMAYDIDSAKMMEVLRIGREKISGKGIASAAKRVDPVRSQTGKTREEVIATMVETFRTLYGLTDGQLTAADMEAAHQLAATKFGTDEWLYKLP